MLGLREAGGSGLCVAAAFAVAQGASLEWCIKYIMVSYHQQGCYHLYQLFAVRVLLKAEALAERLGRSCRSVTDKP